LFSPIILISQRIIGLKAKCEFSVKQSSHPPKTSPKHSKHWAIGASLLPPRKWIFEQNSRLIEPIRLSREGLMIDHKFSLT